MSLKIYVFLFAMLSTAFLACDEPQTSSGEPCQGRCTGASVCEDNRCIFKPVAPDLAVEPDAELDIEIPEWIDLGSVLDASLNDTRERCDTPQAVRACLGDRPESLQACSAAFQRCEQGYWSSCQSGQELCNALDDDCDGISDEGFNLGAECILGLGQCTASGVLECNTQGEVSCTAVVIPAERELCDGLDNDCDGHSDEDFQQLGRICEVGIGECVQQGQFICDTLGGVRCSEIPAEPDIERCDLLDNDCDGQVDESDPQESELCTSDYQGECEAGQFRCLNGALFCEPLQGPRQERCDQLDNDCDGLFDEDGENLGEACLSEAFGICQAGQWTCGPQGEWLCESSQEPQAEVCDLIDNDCDGFTDEQVFADNDLACSTSAQGLCAQGEKRCVAGQIQCRSSYQAQEEVCDGLDNDCDGLVDESDQNLGSECMLNAFGPCALGQMICEQGLLICQALVNPSPELCDQIDNDCDGQSDEDYPALSNRCELGQGVCARTGRLVCSANHLATECIDIDAQEVFPSEESCDGLDNDCDGEVDEAGWGLDDSLHCGACGQQCLLARQASHCAEGQCQADHCFAGWQDDPNQQERCAQACDLKETRDETCNAVDDDCDGLIDEGSCLDQWFINEPICAQRANLGLKDGLCLTATAPNSSSYLTANTWLNSTDPSSAWYNPQAKSLVWSDRALGLPEGTSQAGAQRSLVPMSSTWQMDLKVKLAQEKLTLVLSHRAELLSAIQQEEFDVVNDAELLSQVGGLQIELEALASSGPSTSVLDYHIRLSDLITGQVIFEQNLSASLNSSELHLKLSKNQAGQLSLRDHQNFIFTVEQNLSLNSNLVKLDQLSIALSPSNQALNSNEHTELRLLTLRFDNDQDGIYPPIDNCPEVYNPQQFDRDLNGVGRACDDLDQDLYEGSDDLCPLIPNASQVDRNQNGRNDLCEGLGAVIIAQDNWSGTWAKALDLESGQKMTTPIPIDEAFYRVSYSPESAWWSQNNIIGLLSFVSAQDSTLWWQQELAQPNLFPFDLSGSGAFIAEYFYYVLTDQRTIVRYNPDQALVAPELVYQGELEDWLTIHLAQDDELIIERDREGISTLFSLNTQGEILYPEVPMTRQGQRVALARRSHRPAGYLVHGTEGILQGLLLIREDSGDLESYDEEPVQWFSTTPAPTNEQNQALNERGGGLVFRQNPLYPYLAHPQNLGLNSTAFWAPDLSLGRAEWRPLAALNHDFTSAKFATVTRLPKLEDQDYDGIPDDQDSCPSEALFELNQAKTSLDFDIDKRVSTGVFDQEHYMLNIQNRSVFLNIWNDREWSVYPLLVKIDGINRLISIYQSDSVQMLSCAGSRWLSIIDFYDGELSLFELDQGNNVVSLPEDLRTRFAIPSTLGAEFAMPEYPLSPIMLSCQDQKLHLAQLWLEKSINPSFNRAEASYSWSKLVIDLVEDSSVLEVANTVLQNELPVSPQNQTTLIFDQTDLLREQKHLRFVNGLWLSLILSPEGALSLELWSPTDPSTEIISLLPENFRRQGATLFAEITHDEKLIFALKYEDQSLWLSPTLSLNDLLDALQSDSQDSLQNWANSMRKISQQIENITTLRLESQADQSVATFVGKYPNDSAKAVFLSVLSKEQKIPGPLWQLSQAKSGVLGVTHLELDGRNLQVRWHDQNHTWEYIGALPCP